MEEVRPPSAKKGLMPRNPKNAEEIYTFKEDPSVKRSTTSDLNDLDPLEFPEDNGVEAFPADESGISPSYESGVFDVPHSEEGSSFDDTTDHLVENMEVAEAPPHQGFAESHHAKTDPYANVEISHEFPGASDPVADEAARGQAFEDEEDSEDVISLVGSPRSDTPEEGSGHAETSQSDTYYYARERQMSEPLSRAELEQVFLDNQLLPTDRIYLPDKKKWVEAIDVFEFSADFEQDRLRAANESAESRAPVEEVEAEETFSSNAAEDEAAETRQATEPASPIKSEGYFIRDKKKYGPLTTAQFEELAASSRLLSTDMILLPGTSKWTIAREAIRFPEVAPKPIAPTSKPKIAPSDAWHYARDRKKFGPFTLGQLHQLAASKQLLPTDMLLQPGTGKWIPAPSFVRFPSAPPQRPQRQANQEANPPEVILPKEVLGESILVPALPAQPPRSLPNNVRGHIAFGGFGRGVTLKILIFLDGDFLGQGSMAGGFDLPFEAPLGNHLLELQSVAPATLLGGSVRTFARRSFRLQFAQRGIYNVTLRRDLWERSSDAVDLTGLPREVQVTHLLRSPEGLNAQIVVTCTRCRAKAQIPYAMLGKLVKCPACKAAFQA